MASAPWIAAVFALGLCVAFPCAVRAQATSGTAPPDGAALFKQQCGACHSVTAGEPARQGPNLAGVVGRKPGSVEGFHYSPGFAKADFTWDESHLDAYLTNPQAVIPGAIMPYKQSRAPVRQAIIGYLKEQH